MLHFFIACLSVIGFRLVVFKFIIGRNYFWIYVAAVVHLSLIVTLVFNCSFCPCNYEAKFPTFNCISVDSIVHLNHHILSEWFWPNVFVILFLRLKYGINFSSSTFPIVTYNSPYFCPTFEY